MSERNLLPGIGFVGETKPGENVFAPGAGTVTSSTLTLYWAVVPTALADYTNDDTGAARIRTGKDDTGAALEAGTFGSIIAPLLPLGANTVDALLPPTTQLDPGTSYVIAWTIWDGSAYGGDTTTKVVKSAAFDTASTGANVPASQAETATAVDSPAATLVTSAARVETAAATDTPVRMQYIRPDGVAQAPQNASGTWADIDEVVASDSDYILGANGSSFHYFATFTSPPEGTPVSGTCRVRYRVVRASSVGPTIPASGGAAFNFSAYLYEGTTLRAAGTASAIPTDGSWVDWAYVFNTSLITDWSNVRLSFTCTSPTGYTIALTWAEIEILGSSGIPVLSNPGAIDILALSARPQVTVTY